MKYLTFAILFLIITGSSCSKDEYTLAAKTITNPKQIFNNTSDWRVLKYTNNGVDNTDLLNKYWILFREDQSCAERVIFYHPFSEIWGVWEIVDYANGTVLEFWMPPLNPFLSLEGEWYFNELTNNKIHLFKDNSELILIK